MHSLNTINHLNTDEQIDNSRKVARRLNMADGVCPKHPRYKGLRPPTNGCLDCMRVYRQNAGR